MPPPADLCRLLLLPGGGARCLAVPVLAPADPSRTGGDGEGAWGAGTPGRPEASIRGLAQPYLRRQASPPLGHLAGPRGHHPIPRHRRDSDRLGVPSPSMHATDCFF